MASSRFLVAGAALLTFLMFVNKEKVRPGAWKPAWIMGALLLLGGNGGVVFAEQHVPSGIAALLVGFGPFWFVLLGWLWLRGPRPGILAVGGLILGFLGLVVLVGPSSLNGVGHVPLLPALVVIGAALSWSVGSIYSKTLKLEMSPFMITALQMLAGSVLLAVAGFIHGEHANFSVTAITGRSWAAWAYLVVFGSLVGFSSYIYVLRHASPAVASTYAYVNPMVAVLIGWGVGGETLSSRILLAAAFIVGAVVLISWPQKKPALT